MALTKQSIVDRIEVVGPYSHLQVRVCERVLEDGEVIAEKFHRHIITPGADTSGEDPRVQAIAGILHTPEVISAYQASLTPVEAPAE
jgi:hypothetical protein